MISHFNRWRGTMMLKSVPKEQWGEVRVKSSAIEALEKRKNPYGLQRRWYGDYLDMVSNSFPNNQSIVLFTNVNSTVSQWAIIYGFFFSWIIQPEENIHKANYQSRMGPIVKKHGEVVFSSYIRKVYFICWCFWIFSVFWILVIEERQSVKQGRVGCGLLGARTIKR